jgi:hypothetical protein
MFPREKTGPPSRSIYVTESKTYAHIVISLNARLTTPRVQFINLHENKEEREFEVTNKLRKLLLSVLKVEEAKGKSLFSFNES